MTMRHIPQAKTQSFHELATDKKYLLVCQHGVSSKRLAATLRAAGRESFYSLIGGLTDITLHGDDKDNQVVPEKNTTTTD